LLGTYIVLIKDMQKGEGKNAERFYEFFKIENVLEFIYKNMDVYDIWTY
jgi:hypothetical protein